MLLIDCQSEEEKYLFILWHGTDFVKNMLEKYNNCIFIASIDTVDHKDHISLINIASYYVCM